MAEASEMKHMIMSFRVAELQVLLGFAGKNKSGRKHELQGRALHLLKHGCSTSVQIKIKELYRRRFPRKVHLVHPTAPPPPLSSTNSHSQYTSSSLSSFGLPSSTPSHGVPNLLSSNTAVSHQNGLPIHPDVKLKHLPFFDVVDELIKPTSLVPRGSSKFQETYFVFHLSPLQVSKITGARDVRHSARVEFPVQVQIRFCLAETSCEQDDHFPPSLCVKVNGKMCPLPGFLPQTKSGQEPKRPSRPVSVTALTRLSPTVPNHVYVSWASEYGRGYAIAVRLVKQLSADCLLQRLRSKGIRNADHSRAMIKEKLSQDPDSEIATTSLRVSLTCPLGKMRISISCRSLMCTHIQCFDASLYLQMNEKKPTWICPVCDKKAPFDSLVIDGLFTEILATSPKSDDIQFAQDGSWSVLCHEKEAAVIGSPMDKSKSSFNGNKSSDDRKNRVTMIDLTLDSSDEEDESPVITAKKGEDLPTEEEFEEFLGWLGDRRYRPDYLFNSPEDFL
ncbi:E3 SUMO-protein ligase PIAS1-like isoform X2 [Ptychodera flava]|uniref:E3 SUMO-protein ligase PIAS1-like isoform X2 n=1 Tax=Ptychodera flava TaxID=63121 RepID=UPI00396A9500